MQAVTPVAQDATMGESSEIPENILKVNSYES